LGVLAGSSLVLGGILALVVPIGRRALGLVKAFGAGALISAVAFELVTRRSRRRRAKAASAL
jgi:ZIP family zinc transporter